MEDVVHAHSRFPPSFDDNPFTYAFALASMSAIAFVSIGLLLSWWFEARDHRTIRRMHFNDLTFPQGPGFWERLFTRRPMTLFHYHRVIMGSFLVSFILGTMPDAIVMILWGEAHDATMAIAFDADRICDGLAMIPFMFAVVVGWRCSDSLVHALASPGEYEPPAISWRLVRERGRAVLFILLMSIGVVFYKAQL